MARDFMQDILPKDEPPRPPKRLPVESDDEVEVPERAPEPVPERSIRNINVNRPRPMERMSERPSPDRREVPGVGGGLPRQRKSRSTAWLWLIAAVLLIVLSLFALFMFRSTSVTVTPRVHTVLFDASKSFTAYPAANAPAGTLTYSVQSFDVDDSQPVTAQGMTHAEHKSSGSVTVVNEFSATPLKFVKSTRFQTPDGLIFRAPADITVPGMKGNTPGTIQVTLVADQAGEKYNIPPTARFTLPGLQGSAEYAKVYARSSAPFSGGFSGDEPNVSSETRTAAITELQGRLRDKAMQQIGTLSTKDSTVFPTFAAITFTDMPAGAGATQGQVNLNERAHVEIPVLPTQDFNRLIGSTLSADAESAQLTLKPKQGFAATLLNATSTAYGTSPVSFTLAGSAQLVWGVDTAALAQALAGKDQSAFQTIVNGFPGVEEARARIEPFWKHTFPSDPKNIAVTVNAPPESSSP